MTTETTYPIEGSCQCGNIRLRLLRAPKLIACCHCRECQKLSTSAFSITAVVDACDVEIEGELKHWERKAESGNTIAAKFCPHCGNRIYHYHPDKPDVIRLKPTYLEDTRFIQPTAHIWVSEKQDWFTLPEDVPCYPKQPGG
ncbi:GFA family protein [Neptuniibacter sp. CAU 1671]|uniref:GFA family protein n=1 Tax=Neptuniibacter sp. CAU 1671 TaxID=3032593 RepID=UPI0023D982AF|nr:GFA family protein [Neptuniibacter sp. CAU 1671]MDF2180840.1 GFA family protein [Neptuniibacter sp. CAU 1671]